MAQRLVHCRVCKQGIDRDKEVENVDWIMPSKNYFYHKKCYDEWKRKKNDIHADAEDDMWFESLKEYLMKDIKMSIDFAKITSQWKNLIKQGRTAKGIYFAVKYFYDIRKGDPKKSENGIGIVSHIYEESCAYWFEREKHDKGICDRIAAQIRQREEQEKIVLIARPHQRKKTVDLSIVEEMEDEDGR